MAAGRKVWFSPDVLPWEAWLAREWRAAALRGTTAALQLLSPGQERALWEDVLQDLAGDGESLAAHANALIRAAAKATQSLIVLSRSAMSAEEQLLVQALTEVRRRAAARGWLSLRLAPPEALQFLRDVKPPAIMGTPRLTALQEALRQQYWTDSQVLLQASARGAAAPVLHRFPGLEAELAACAEWCLQHLRAGDGSARLLVLSACTEPSLAIQGELLWRRLAGSERDSLGLRNQLLAIEGGTPLPAIGLIAAALLGLDCLAPQIDTGQLYAVLRSPYFQFGSQIELWKLQGRFERWGLARWPIASLEEALQSVAGQDAAAGRLLAWLEVLRTMRDPHERLSASTWAQRFNDALAAAGFNQRSGADSREHQQFERWGELLDEFTSLDAVLPPLEASAALTRLRSLAAAGRYQVASGDAAITLGSELGDPVIDYDGIWVLGLAETRWPAPPRPDAYVAIQEQRAQHWPEASAAGRREQAVWALSRWQQCSGELVLSYPEMEGDLHHRPSPVPGKPASAWTPGHMPADVPVRDYAVQADDQQFPPWPVESQDQLLPGGAECLRVQQQCPFRAQAQWRLKAMAPAPLSDGLTPTQRGTLLHALLQGLWGELQDQPRLLCLTPEAERELLERHWQAALAAGAVPGSRWWPASLRERERERTMQVVGELLGLERTRAPFKVIAREQNLHWPSSGPRLKLRIDRIDDTGNKGRLLIDYKSGAEARILLQEGILEPLQLGLYVTALASRGEPVTSAALLSVQPDAPAFSGVAAPDDPALPGLKTVADWEAMAGQWQQQLLDLLAAHLSGSGTLATDHAACRYCHLPALCRRASVEDQEDADE